MQEARRFPCVPCFIFLKVSWNVSNRSFPALTVFPVWIDRRVVNGIKHWLQWKDTPDEYGLHKTLYNRFVRQSKLGIFNKVFTRLANKTPFDSSLRSTPSISAYRTAASLLKKGILHVLKDERRPESKFHIVYDGHGRPVLLLLTEGQVSGTGVQPSSSTFSPITVHFSGRRRLWRNVLRESLKNREMPICMPSRKVLSSMWLLHLHSTVKIQPFYPVFPLAEPMAKTFYWLCLWNFKEKSINHFYDTASRKSRNKAFPFDNALYNQRHVIENTFSRLKDWRRLATRYDRCAHTFFSAICLAVTVIFYLN